MLFGSKVFMSERSPLYKNFLELGVSIHNLENELSQKELSTPLDTTQIDSNRQLISDYYSRENIVASLRKSIQLES